MTKEEFKADFLHRISEIKRTRWIRFGVVTFIFLLWVLWMQNAWLLIFLPLLFDIYITGYIPFTWWKKSKKPWVRAVMSWVDAIVYALILVYFVFNFIGQNYQIPSSSLEKTLLTGDYLWVNKLTYGPRVPMTPVHFPLVHNTLPFIGTKSYLDWPSVKYHRLKGLRNVERNDIVVFNFPAGDTVATRFEESPEYYQLLVNQYGWKRVNTDKQMFGDIIYRPVDRRQNFVKRCVGLPGEYFKIVDDIIYINGKPQSQPKDVQFNYFMAAKLPLDDDTMHELEITAEDVHEFPQNSELYQEVIARLPKAKQGNHLYSLPMTSTMISELSNNGILVDYVKMNDLEIINPGGLGYMYPPGIGDTWTVSNYGGDNGILIPKKGQKIKLTPESWDLYNRVIRNYEGHTNSYIDKNGVVYIDGKKADTYTFEMDYYFMMGDNRDNSQDSRFWGFVPEDHIVGTPMFVLISFDKDRSIFNGGIRWNRIFKDANPDK